MTDAEIERSVALDRDAAPVDMDWSSADVVLPAAKQVISIRLDKDIVEHFKRAGRGYQTKINSVLRSYVQYERRHAKN
jgi:uncharacterized protein (DUF4415 family)